MLTFIPFVALTIAGIICFWFLVSVSNFTLRQMMILTVGGAVCALFSFGLLYEMRDAVHWIPTTMYIVVAFVCFWLFTRWVYLGNHHITRREAALVILWGQAMFPLLMAIALIW